MKNITIIASTVVVVFVVILGMYFLQKSEPTTEYAQDDLATFATCLRESGAKFYGAFWCGHCRNQKAAFKESADLLPYIECSSEDPTWEFSDGTRLTGEVSFSVLAEKSGCPAPVL